MTVKPDPSHPLAGLRVIEMEAIGPAPYCGLLLSQMGAEVTRIMRASASGLGIDVPAEFDYLNAGKATVVTDLKSPDGVAATLDLIADADVLIEGFRPGVMEKLGLGPEQCAIVNPRLVYGRMTGWGQEGPLAQAAGHDLNYIAITGALAAIGEAGGPPVVPLNLIGDFGGGALFLAMGVLAAVSAARQTGHGSVVDAAIVDGVTSMLTLQRALYDMGEMSLERGTNLIDGGAPFYSTYETADGKWISVAAVEPKFFQELITRIGLPTFDLKKQYDKSAWPSLKQELARTFLTRNRAEWCDVLEGSDACFAPVLNLIEAQCNDHQRSRRGGNDSQSLGTSAIAPRFLPLGNVRFTS